MLTEMDNTVDNNKGSAVRQPLIGMTLARLQDVVAELGLPRFNAGQIARWLYVRRVTDIDSMTDLSKTARAKLAARYCVGRTAPLQAQQSADGTIKYLFDSGIGNDIRNTETSDRPTNAVTDKATTRARRPSPLDVEAVYIPDRDRATLCVSSQAGCKMHCAFCMTGRQGFHGNLSAAAIVNQILSIDNPDSLTNIVFMGMGEPTDNLPAVLDVISILTAPWGLAWSPKRITVSSIGKLPEMQQLIEQTNVHIALSLHSPYATQRAELMPAEKAWPLHSVVDMLRNYDFAHQRRLSVEYIMWDGVNDSPAHAETIARLLRGTSARVNLIRFHAIPGSPLRTSPRERMEAFRDRLNELGVIATIRASRGEDILAACGMLAGKKTGNTSAAADNATH